ncbi:MAG: DUF2079 domain-containing protein [Candidatus Omnitrophica bacterium]|nr:DUF2079 domain-containing protein [Candidatus Omnitrophota bacterium]
MKRLLTFYEENRSIVLLCLVGFFLYAFFILYRYIHFAYDDWDMAFLNQCLWNLSHGKLFSSLYGFNCFGDHSTFINLFALPIFMLFPHPLTFSFIQIALFISSVFLLYVIAKEGLGKLPAFIIALTYLVFPPNLFAMCHDCNPESLAPFFLLLAVYSYRKKNLGGYFVSIIFLFLIKENMPLIVGMLSLWGIFAQDRNRIKWGVVPLAISFCYFLIAAKFIIPHFRGMEQSSLWVRFSYLGSTPKDILHKLFQFRTLKGIFLLPANIDFLKELFGALLLPAILSPTVLSLISPVIAYHLISSHFPEKTIFYSYSLTMTPIIFLAAIQTLTKIKRWPSFHTLFCLFLLGASLLNLYPHRGQIKHKIGFDANHYVNEKWSLVSMIPPNASVITTFEFLPALSLRNNLYSIHKIYSKDYQEPDLIKLNVFNTGKPFKTPYNVQYALINFDDTWIQDGLNNDPVYTEYKLDAFLKQWKEVAGAGPVKLYKRRTTQ